MSQTDSQKITKSFAVNLIHYSIYKCTKNILKLNAKVRLFLAYSGNRFNIGQNREIAIGKPVKVTILLYLHGQAVN